ncbi:MAG: hypothetical protein GXY83_08950 [Rhodopirellula sp.]|nr:hypothetical protein [Rhodopirellula sp.]
MTYRGHIKNGVAVLDEPTDLPEGTPVLIQPVETFGFQENLSIAQLIERQQVRPVTHPADLAGDWPLGDSLEEFLSAVREGRR